MDNYLQKLFINEAKPALKRYSRGSGSSGDGVDVGTLLDFIEGNTTELRCPALNKVANGVFSECDALTTVNLPNATTIGEYAFNFCRALTTVNLPQATIIGADAFYNGNALTTVDLPSATTIGEYAFENCNALTTVNLPQATNIGVNAFHSCDALTSIDLPQATKIGGYVFAYCDSFDTLILRSDTMCNMDLSAVFGTKLITDDGMPTGEGFTYVPSSLYESYVADWIPKIFAVAEANSTPMDEATATYIATAVLRKIEDYPEICNPAN